MFAESLDADGVAVITGGASGFGLAAARRCVAAGMRVAILDVSASELRAAEQALEAAARVEAAPVPAEAPRRQRESPVCAARRVR